MELVYEPIIGLEVHAQLLTQSKMFCGCATTFGQSPNAQTCPVCLGMPGALPVLNEAAVELAVRAGLGLGCQIHHESIWARKNYFYPDLPKGYQITQDKKPFASQGLLTIDADGIDSTIRITRIHMEEDAGKNVHDAFGQTHQSYVDFNRGGTGLIEIVSEPDLRSSSQAAAYLKTLRQILRYLEVCDGNMEQGSFRCDANVSLRPKGQKTFGTRVELKNLNSFKFVAQAIDYEIIRQEAELRRGQPILQETRLWDTQAKATRSMRSKESAADYRYFPEPDLPALYLTDETIAAIQEGLPELPAAKRQRYIESYDLSPYDARVLTDDMQVSAFFEDAILSCKHYKAVANWICNELLRELKDKPFECLPFAGHALGELIDLIEQGKISGKMAKELFAELMLKGGSPKHWVASRNLSQLSDHSTLLTMVEEVMQENLEAVAKYRSGKTNILGFLVGCVLKKSRGQANPQMVHELMQQQLNDAS